MKLSLEIIGNYWERLGDSALIYREKDHVFYRSVRFLTEDIQILQRDTLYVAYEGIDLPQRALTKEEIKTLVMDLLGENRRIQPGSGVIFTVKKETDTQVNQRNLKILYEAYDESPLELAIGIVTGASGLETFNRLLAVYEYYDDYDKVLMNALNGASPLQEIIHLIGEMTGNPAYVVDQNYRVLAMDQNPHLPYVSIYWKRIRENGFLPYDVVSSILDNPEWEIMQDARSPVLMQTSEFASRFLACNIWMDHRILWRVFVTETEKAIGKADLDMVSILAEYLKHALLSDWKYRDQKENLHELFLREVASGTILSRQFLAEQLQLLRWNIQDRYCLLEIQIHDFDGYLRELITKEFKSRMDCLYFSYEGRFFLVFALGDSLIPYESLSEQVASVLAPFNCNGLLSNDFYGFQFLPVYVKQTGQMGEFLGNKMSYMDYQNFFMDYLKETLVQKQEMIFNSMKPGFLQRLSQYDKEHDSELYKSLFQFLRSDRNLVKTARELHIHRNTLVYRLDQIEKLIGEKLERPTVRLMVWLWMELENLPYGT